MVTILTSGFAITGFFTKRTASGNGFKNMFNSRANIATRQANLTCHQDAGEHFMMRNDDNAKRRNRLPRIFDIRRRAPPNYYDYVPGTKGKDF